MHKIILPVICFGILLAGCAGLSGSPQDTSALSVSAPGGGTNAFNPYMQSELPNLRGTTGEGRQMLGHLGGKVQSIEEEARHRKNWRDELYPVVFGDKKAPHEIIVVLNFAEPACENLWKAVVSASKSLSPKQCKIVVFGKSSENYGTDLMGLAIWLAHSRPGKAMPYLTYALGRWNAVKAAQKSSGTIKSFTNEYDATATSHDYPIHYGYLMQLNPPVPTKQEPAVAKYCYDAGNVNMYQAVQICQYYGVRKLPAVIVDGKVLGKISTDTILSALK
jgi:hypothetical protein